MNTNLFPSWEQITQFLFSAWAYLTSEAAIAWWKIIGVLYIVGSVVSLSSFILMIYFFICKINPNDSKEQHWKTTKQKLKPVTYAFKWLLLGSWFSMYVVIKEYKHYHQAFLASLVARRQKGNKKGYRTGKGRNKKRGRQR